MPLMREMPTGVMSYRQPCRQPEPVSLKDRLEPRRGTTWADLEDFRVERALETKTRTSCGRLGSAFDTHTTVVGLSWVSWVVQFGRRQ